MAKRLEEYAGTSPVVTEADRKKVMKAIADFMISKDISVDDLGMIERVKVYQGFHKDKDGDAHTVDMSSITLSPSWADGPAWPPVQPVTPATIKYGRPPTARHEGRVTVLLPDPQIGFRRYEDGSLVPMHDELAIDTSIELLSEIRPDRVIDLGDFLDMSPWSSKFIVHPEFVLTTQPSLEYGHEYLARQRAAVGPDADIDLMEGNHDDRLAIAITKNAMEAMRLRQAGTPPESWPVLSIPNLLNLESLGVNYAGAYPAGRLKVADAHGDQTPLYALHGTRLDMKKQATTERQSTVQGHSHHVACHCETYDYDGQPQQVQAWSLGCLCRLDGHVPSTGSKPDAKGVPVPHVESWQHAVGVVTETDDGWWLEPVFIHNGKAMYHGKLIGG